MASFVESLRAESIEMRGMVRTMLERLTSRPSFLHDKLDQLAQTPDLPAEVVAKIEAIDAEYGTADAVYTSLATVISGSVTANIMDAFADHIEYLTERGSLKHIISKRKEVNDFNARLRELAAAGRWDEWDAEVDNHFRRQEKTGSPEADESGNESEPGSQTDDK